MMKEVQQCHGRNDALPAGGLMRLMGVLEGRSGWWSQAKYVKGVRNMLIDGLGLWGSITLIE